MSNNEPAKPPMICDGCGATMNHHAMKIDYSVEDSVGDPIFGGALQEVHTCPQCHRIVLRRA
jgi:ribosomal protein L37AE/L43A